MQTHQVATCCFSGVLVAAGAGADVVVGGGDDSLHSTRKINRILLNVEMYKWIWVQTGGGRVFLLCCHCLNKQYTHSHSLFQRGERSINTRHTVSTSSTKQFVNVFFRFFFSESKYNKSDFRVDAVLNEQ